MFVWLLGSSQAEANGRPPATSTINFKVGDETKIYAGLTFGALSSNDGGATWNWICEDAVGYGGNYDPDYAFTATGEIFATTFDGLKVRRDTCTFTRSVLTETEGPCIDDADPDSDANNCPTPGFTCAADNVCEKLKFVSTTTIGPDGAIYVSSADALDARIYKSTDNGATFPISANRVSRSAALLKPVPINCTAVDGPTVEAL